ncbi:hypothetical protein E2C01_088001 [Portunus trituberculatus]|uniref:Uncharacterized protein n=1 Tax=Portunus trituberculatus TaxID=210409 RepID=A0A5B7JIQ6_PORTR|nr:hypothetical protein [Portunus trituberculatus]
MGTHTPMESALGEAGRGREAWVPCCGLRQGGCICLHEEGKTFPTILLTSATCQFRMMNFIIGRNSWPLEAPGVVTITWGVLEYRRVP